MGNQEKKQEVGGKKNVVGVLAMAETTIEEKEKSQ